MIQARAFVSRQLLATSGLLRACGVWSARLQMARAFWCITVLVSCGTFVLGLPRLQTLLFNPSGAVRAALASDGLGVETRGLILFGLIVGSTMTAFGAAFFIAWRRSDDLMALFVSWMLVSFTASIGTPEFHGSPLLTVIQGVREWIAWSSLPIFLLLFPDGRFRPRWGVWAAIGASVGQALGIAGGNAVPDVIPTGTTIVAFLLGSAGQVLRSRSASSVTRQQTRWVLAGFFIAICGLVGINFTLSVLGTSTRNGTVGSLVLSGILLLCILAVPVSITAAILRYRLFDIHVFVNRTLVFISLSAVAVLLYLSVSAGVTLLLPHRGSALSSIAAAVAIALLFAPLRHRLQRSINRLMYGRRDDPYSVLTVLGKRLESTIAVDDVLTAVVDTVMQTLRLPYASLSLVVRGEHVIAASRGHPVGETRSIPLFFRAEQVGVLHVSPRGPNETLSQEDMTLLTDLARQAGVAAHDVRLTTELRHSRERIVTAREEERRRLRRDLHDGLGPTLASLTLMAEAARNLLDVDTVATRAILDDLRGGAQTATDDIRRVVYELRPPALDDVGLLGILQRVAETLRNAGIAAAFDTPQHMEALPAAVEVAAYRVIQEAVTNVIRHAHASRCVIRLDVGACLTVMVQDNGRGIGSASSGMGRMSMCERADELGGICTIEDADGGGTVVQLVLPIERVAQVDA